MNYEIDWQNQYVEYDHSDAKVKATLTNDKLVLLFESHRDARSSGYKDEYSGSIHLALHCNTQTTQGVYYVHEGKNYGQATEVPYELTGSFVGENWQQFEGYWKEGSESYQFTAICVDEIEDARPEENQPMIVESNISTSYQWAEFHEKLMALDINNCDESDPAINEEIHLIDYDKLRSQFSDFKNQYSSILKEKIDQLKGSDNYKDNPVFSSFSLLRVLDKTGLRETAHTRILAWLFDSKNIEQHGFTNLFIPILKKITQDNKEWPQDGEYTITKVESEKTIQDQRRTDIWIEGEVKFESKVLPWLIVIEAKVKSFIGENQLPPYEQEARDWKKTNENAMEPCLVLLTINKSNPEENVGWQSLTFLDLFYLLWSAVSNQFNSEQSNIDGYYFCRGYLSGILSDIYKWKLPLTSDNPDYHALELCKKILTNHS